MNFLYAQPKVWTLKDCIEQALKKNISLNKEKLNNEVSKINFQQSKENLLPDLNFTDAHTFSFGRSIDPVSNEFANQYISGNNMSLNSNLLLFNGLQNVNTIHQSKLNYDAGLLDVEKLKDDLSLNVLAMYVQVLF